MDLKHQIEENRKKIVSESYPMSIGEVINLYKEGDLDVHPEFQRFYRWDVNQKSNLIESIILGIPLPSFFVSTRDDGIWDLVDGLQRLATILSFVGEYVDDSKNTVEPLTLEKTKYLPELEGFKWNNADDTSKEFPVDLKRDFKRYKIDIKIIKKESDPRAKYDLFQRLNTGGTQLEAQEVRNCLLIMVNRSGFEYLTKLSSTPSFKQSIPITERMVSASYYNELVLRFLIIREIINNEIVIDTKEGVDDFISDWMVKIFTNSSYNFHHAKHDFHLIFTFLCNELNEDSFKTFKDNSFKGPFILSRFEVICSILLSKIRSGSTNFDCIKSICKELHYNQEFNFATAPGTRALTRTSKLIELGKQLAQEK